MKIQMLLEKLIPLSSGFLLFMPNGPAKADSLMIRLSPARSVVIAPGPVAQGKQLTLSECLAEEGRLTVHGDAGEFCVVAKGGDNFCLLTFEEGGCEIGRISDVVPDQRALRGKPLPIDQDKFNDSYAESIAKRTPQQLYEETISKAEHQYDEKDYGWSWFNYAMANKIAEKAILGTAEVGYPKCMTSILNVTTRNAYANENQVVVNCVQSKDNAYVKSGLALAKISMPQIGMTGADNAQISPHNKPVRQQIGDACLIVEPIETLIGCGSNHQHWWWTNVKLSHRQGCPSDIKFTDNEPDSPGGRSEGEAPARLQNCGGPATNIKPFVDVPQP